MIPSPLGFTPHTIYLFPHRNIIRIIFKLSQQIFSLEESNYSAHPTPIKCMNCLVSYPLYTGRLTPWGFSISDKNFQYFPKSRKHKCVK